MSTPMAVDMSGGSADGGDGALHRLRIAVPDLDLARRLHGRLTELEALDALAATMFEVPGESGYMVDAYVRGRRDCAEIATALDLAPDAVRRCVTLERVPDENWVAVSQAALPVVAAGRFLVHGSHDRTRAGTSVNAIEIDAGEAFGTAHHATTSGCLLAIDRLAHGRAPRAILDLGCGSGVLAIAAARVWPRARVLASDSDPVAVEVAMANVRRNRAGPRLRPLVARGLAHPLLRRPGAFDLVIANILAAPLIALAPGLSRAIVPGGRAILSGLLTHQGPHVRARYRGLGFCLERETRIAGWSIVELRRVEWRERPN